MRSFFKHSVISQGECKSSALSRISATMVVILAVFRILLLVLLCYLGLNAEQIL
jgi:hypothetical protein